MKTLRIFTAVLSMALAFSCQKDILSDNQVTRETESATLETGAPTKTSLTGKEVHWTSDDVIAVFDDSNYKNTFTITDASGSYANFTGSVTKGTTQIYAVYPENLALSASGSALKVNIPANQTSKAGSFAEEHNISVAKASKIPGVETIGDVTFSNVCSYLKFTVPSSVKDVKTVKFETSKAIAGEATVDASSDAPVAVVSDKGSKSVTMSGTYSAGSEFLFVLAPGTINGFTVTVNTANATWSVTKDVKVTLEAGKYKNLGVLDFELGVSASAAHTYSDKTLTGTDVTVNLNLEAAKLAYVTSLNLQVTNANGDVVRKLEKTSASVTEVLAANSDWPYLPQGTYTVSGSYKIDGKKERKLTPLTFDSPAPTFEVTSNAYTSYTKYKNGDTSGANGCVAETIYNVTNASVSIVDKILNNSNYSSIKGGYSYKLDGNATTTVNATNQSWGAHTVIASYNFDGVTVEGKADCHITGLPYKEQVPKNTGTYKWSENEESTLGKHNIKWNNDGVKLEGSSLKQIIYSPSFNVPNNVNVKLAVPVELYSIGVGAKAIPELKCRISGVQSFTKKGLDPGRFGSKTETYSGTGTGSLTTSNPIIEIENAYTMASAYIYVKKVTIEYN
jgi:hypothetical protein